MTEKYFSSATIREADRIAANEFGVPGEVLMENAGRGAAEAIAARYPDRKNILILCGPGNNGGDGFVAARHLSIAGRRVTIIATRRPEDYAGEASCAAMSAKKTGIRILFSGDLGDGEIVSLAEDADVLVDALLGTGSSGAPRGETARLINLTAGRSPFVAFDAPSGVDADTGEVAGAAVKADVTLTFLAPKPGLVVAPGMFHSGEIKVVGIGVDPAAVLRAPGVLTGYGASDIKSMKPEISPDIHKGSRGSLLVAGGSEDYRGAPALAAFAALKAGCGLVGIASTERVISAAASVLPEAIFITLPEEDGHISPRGLEDILAENARRFDAMVFGPGAGRYIYIEEIARIIYENWTKPLLIDADALRADYAPRRENIVATPHAGEAGFILGSPPAEVEAKRLRSAAALAEKFGVALLKGPHTIISNGDETRVISEGGPELAVPGSGDVLSGVVGAYLAAGKTPMDAATLGALSHAAAGRAASGGNPNGILAREIAAKLCTI